MSQTKGWFARLKQGLTKTSNHISESIQAFLTHKSANQEDVSLLEKQLILADFGPSLAKAWAHQLSDLKFKSPDLSSLQEALAQAIERQILPYAKTFTLSKEKPFIVLNLGVNGVGKTTASGKLAFYLKQQGLNVCLVAADSFRAGAQEQLALWGDRAGCTTFTMPMGKDPSGLIYDVLSQAGSKNWDAIIIDTAGRLHNQANLMAQLEKMTRVIQKLYPQAPHETLLVLDATTGQNAHTQLTQFKACCPITGLILNKLDGSAKGGIAISLTESFKLPIYFLGVGEDVEDFRPFEAKSFAKHLAGIL
jgi:fused signal recognition particle receptor